MYLFLIVLISVVLAAIFVGLLYRVISKGTGHVRAVITKLNDDLAAREKLQEQVQGIVSQLQPIDQIRIRVRDLTNLRDAVKTEKGRLTITQAELETVESRLRELEEIERELAASGIDAQEEVKILKKKERDLAQKNQTLREQLEASLKQMDSIMGELELSAQMSEQITAMKTHVLQVQEKIDNLLIQIEQCNEQYFTLKKRYDALDIEYAQLYEKFSAAEEAAGKK
jgi:chromosome segregation ATPase